MRFPSVIAASGGLALLVVLLAATPAPAADNRYVQVAETRMRREASFLSPAVAVLGYGDVVNKQGDANGNQWLFVTRPDGKEGWLHQSALTSTRLVLKAGEQSLSGRGGSAEATLAGKGYSEETERNFQKNHQQLDFAALDRLDEARPDDEEIARFAAEGQLRP
jgi:lipopolysaccharide export LptBFGC system permease protein LptF